MSGWPATGTPPYISSGELLLSTLLTCVCAELEAVGRPVCSCAVRHAIQWPSMEGCCDCDHSVAPAVGPTHGQAWARFQRIDTYTTAYLADDTTCDQTLSFFVDIGVHRCVAVYGDELGSPADPADYTADALSLVNDEAHIRHAINCCPEPAPGTALTGWRWRVTQSLPLGPMGGCAGVVVTVQATGVPRFQ